MSLILDALNRAERERKKTQDIPDLQTVHEPLPSDAGTSAERNPAFTVMGLIVVGLLVAVIYMFVRTPDPAPVASQPVTTLANSEAVSSKQVEPESKLEVPTLTEAVNPQPKAPPAQTRVNPSTRPAVTDSATQADLDELYSSAQAEVKPKDPVDRLYTRPEPENVAGVRSETVVPLPPVAVRNYESLVNIPDIGDLPWGFRQEIPSINYVRHNFGGEGADSLVLNGKAFYAGSMLAPDLLLEEIYVDGAIFQFKQIKFKLRALNSWVNM